MAVARYPESRKLPVSAAVTTLFLSDEDSRLVHGGGNFVTVDKTLCIGVVCLRRKCK